MKKRAFTLAEVMIVLTVIGILTAIILPSARNLMPDKALMKFKKAHNTLGMVIAELVNSDKYYCNGDLGLMPDCSTKITSAEGKREYFCRTMTDILNVKKESCYTQKNGGVTTAILLSNEYIVHIATGQKMVRNVTEETINATKEQLDIACRNNTPDIGPEITLSDGVEFFQNGTAIGFGTHAVSAQDYNSLEENISLRFFTPIGETPANYSDKNGFDISYKIYCIDIDGIHPKATTSDCVNECPFGYGIRNDGKILTGKKADEWLAKDEIQN